MKIVVIVSGADQLATAGVRIRYNRLKQWLTARGHQIEVAQIQAFRATTPLTADVYLFSKCYDARAQLLAAMLADAGAQVGVDFFDDYFTQAIDSRFVHLRQWLKSIAPSLTFSLCATPPMRDSLQDLLPGLPCHIVSDPFDVFDPEQIARSVAGTAARVRETRELDIGWFGIGDNPHFPVGIDDLAALGEVAAACRRRGFAPRLVVLTNPRALTVERLEKLAALPIPVRVEQWNEQREQALISECLVCLLPVNAQPFSTVKSLNRAITTLTGGAQVLSIGFPLYAELGPLIYRSMDALIDDLEADCLALRAETLPDLKQRLKSVGCPEIKAEKLSAFLAALPHRQQASLGHFAVIHGQRSSPDIHKFAQSLGQMSVATPLTDMRLHFDVSFTRGDAATDALILLSERARDCLSPPYAALVAPHGPDSSNRFCLPLPSEGALATLVLRAADGGNAADLFRTPMAVALTEALLQDLFPALHSVIAEARSPITHSVTLQRANDQSAMGETA